MNNEDTVQKIVNLPEYQLRITPFKPSDFFIKNNERIARIEKELRDGFNLIKNHPKSVTFFGSARFSEDNKHYIKARRLAGKISAEGYAVATGGGPGIMEAANRGAKETIGNRHSLGMSIELPHEQSTNPYVTCNTNYHYFFTRKVIMSFSANAYIYFPGGFGTLDEFFEILTLVQTHKIPKAPLILVGEEFWRPMQSWIENTILENISAISKDDMNLYKITDNEVDIVDIILNSPSR